MATEGDIREAQRKAVGGERKRCRKGKSCSATCISGIKECLVQMSSGISNSLGRLGGMLSGKTRRDGKEKYERIKGRLLRGIEKSALQGTTSGENLKKRLLRVEQTGKRLRPKGEAEELARQAKAKGEARSTRFHQVVGELEGRMKGYLDKGDMGNYYKMEKALYDVESKAGPKFGYSPSISALDRLKSSLTGEQIKRVGDEYLKEFHDRLIPYKEASKKIERMENRILNSRRKLGENDLKRLKILDRSYIDVERRMLREFASLRKSLLETNLSEDGIKKVESYFATGGLTKGDNRAINEFIRMFNGRGIKRTNLDDYQGGMSLFYVERGGVDRAYAQRFKGDIKLSKSSTKETLFHELGHFLEYSSPILSRYAEEWRNSMAISESSYRFYRKHSQIASVSWRTSPETGGKKLPMAQLRNLIPKSNYDVTETAIVSNPEKPFMHPYMGKVYPAEIYLGNRLVSTEVISMAVQEFNNHAGMSELYKKHPDLFSFVVGLTQIQ